MKKKKSKNDSGGGKEGEPTNENGSEKKGCMFFGENIRERREIVEKWGTREQAWGDPRKKIFADRGLLEQT